MENVSYIQNNIYLIKHISKWIKIFYRFLLSDLGSSYVISLINYGIEDEYFCLL